MMSVGDHFGLPASVGRPAIRFSQGDEWKALISRYITVIPLIGAEACVAVQIMSGWLLKKADHSAMRAKVGAPARPSQEARPGAASPLPSQVLAS